MNPPAFDLTGYVLAGRYQVLRRIGAGGMGTVYHAHDRELDEPVALKVVLPDYAMDRMYLDRFRHEVKLARRVTHMNVARTFELGWADGIAYYTMELVEGESLRQRMNRGPIPVAEAVAITRAVCAALAAAHAVDVVHRDIKPDNILIARTGRIVVVDFGIASVARRQEDHIAGTPAYMAPEQALGDKVTGASDLYAVGLVLFEMLAGQPAFSGDLVEIAVQKDSLPHVTLPGTDPETQRLAVIVACATKRDPSQRIGSAHEMHRMLDAFGQEPPQPIVASRVQTPVTLHTVIVPPPRISSGERSHVAQAMYEAFLEHLGKEPRVRLSSVMNDRRDTILVELEATDFLAVTITPPTPARTLRMHLSLDLEHTSVTTTALVAAVRTFLDHNTPELPLDALDLLLRARSVALTSQAAATTARELIARAAELAPDHPRIVAMQAMVETQLAFYAVGNDKASMERARQLVERALDLDAGAVETRLSAGKLELNIGDAPRAAQHFRAAITAAPHVAEAHLYLGRMLLEAGFVAEAEARLRHAAILDPRNDLPRLDLARAYALEGDWSRANELLAQSEGSTSSWLAQLLRSRLALWRGDTSALATARTVFSTMAPSPQTAAFITFATVVLEGTWEQQRENVARLTLQTSPSNRRRTINAQVGVELAAFHGDTEMAAYILGHAVSAGLFDLHWFARCPLLAEMRGMPAVQVLRAQIERRANAILDALYGDAESAELPNTVVL